MNITLTYFKPTGKYYADGKLSLPEGTDFWTCLRAVEEAAVFRRLPGLCEGSFGWTILVQVEGDHPPHLLHPPA